MVELAKTLSKGCQSLSLSGDCFARKTLACNDISLVAAGGRAMQERLVFFAANFIRWATCWLDEQADPQANTLNLRQMGIKRQVQVGAHVSARVIEGAQGKMLRFSACSAFSGRVLALRPSRSP